MKKSFLGILFLFSISALSFQLFAASSDEWEDVDFLRQPLVLKQKEANQKKYEEHLEYGFRLLAEEKYWNHGKEITPKIDSPQTLIEKMNFIGAYQFNDQIKIKLNDFLIENFKRGEDEKRVVEEREKLKEAARKRTVEGKRETEEKVVLVDDDFNLNEGDEPSVSKSEAKLESRASELESPRGEKVEGEYFDFYPKLVTAFIEKYSKKE